MLHLWTHTPGTPFYICTLQTVCHQGNGLLLRGSSPLHLQATPYKHSPTLLLQALDAPLPPFGPWSCPRLVPGPPLQCPAIRAMVYFSEEAKLSSAPLQFPKLNHWEQLVLYLCAFQFLVR